MELFIDRTWRPHYVDLSIIDEEHLSEAPRVIRGVSVYLNDRDKIIAYLLADYLRNNDISREDSTISFWDHQRGAYVFGFNMTRDITLPP